MFVSVKPAIVVAVVVIGIPSTEVMTPPVPVVKTVLSMPEPMALACAPVAWLREPMALLRTLLAVFWLPIALLLLPDALF